MVQGQITVDIPRELLLVSPEDWLLLWMTLLVAVTIYMVANVLCLCSQGRWYLFMHSRRWANTFLFGYKTCSCLAFQKITNPTLQWQLWHRWEAHLLPITLVKEATGNRWQMKYNNRMSGFTRLSGVSKALGNKTAALTFRWLLKMEHGPLNHFHT